MTDHSTQAKPDPGAVDRTWFPRSTATIDRLGGRSRFACAIDDLAWIPYVPPFPPLIDLMLRVLITEFELPETNRVGVITMLRSAWLLGMQSPVGNGLTTRVYILQQAGHFIPIAVDIW